MTIVPLNRVQSIIFKNDVSFVAVLLCTTSYNKAIKWGRYHIVGFGIHLSLPSIQYYREYLQYIHTLLQFTGMYFAAIVLYFTTYLCFNLSTQSNIILHSLLYNFINNKYLIFYFIYTEWPEKMYTLFTHQYLWNKLWQCLDADGGHFEHLHWIQNSRTSLISMLLLYKYSSYD